MLLSTEQIDTRDDEHDIKKVTSAEFLRSLLIRQNALFAFVTAKNLGSPKDMQNMASIDVVIDLPKSHYISLNEKLKGYTKFYVYTYESMATTFREYKTLRMCEFYGMSDTLMNPQPGLKQITEENKLLEGENVKVMRDNMEKFCKAHADEFNKSQLEVL